MLILSDKKRELLAARLTELGNYTIASLFISQFLAEGSFNSNLGARALGIGILMHLTGLLISH